VRLSNTGGQRLDVTAQTNAGAALSFPGGTALSVEPGQSASLQLEARVTGVPDGTSTYTVTLGSNGGEAVVTVRVRIGHGQADKDAAVALLTEDSTGKLVGVAETKAAWADGYTFELDVPAGTYYLGGGIDEDGDGTYFEEGERSGIYPTLAEPGRIRVVASETVEVGFSLAAATLGMPPMMMMPEPTMPAIGSACTQDSACPGSAVCAMSWPGGYCVASCATTACPSGSACYPIDASTQACLATCSGPGTGRSTCRERYVCYASSSGQGLCAPACTSDADCGTSRCDTSTGYCG
jgi:serine protease